MSRPRPAPGQRLDSSGSVEQRDAGGHAEGWPTTGPARASRRHAVEHHADLSRWLGRMSDRREPEWRPAHEIVLECPVAAPARLLAGLARSRSCRRWCCRRRRATTRASSTTAPSRARCRSSARPASTRAYSMEWVGATQDTKHYGIERLPRRSSSARVEHIGGPVNLIGDCQGGWLAADLRGAAPRARQHAHARRRARSTSTPASGRSPTGSHAVFDRRHGLLRGARGRRRRRHAGRATSSAASSPSSPRTRSPSSCSCWRNLDDAGHVERYAEFEDWFKHTQDIPGDFYLWIVEELFRDNKLISRRARGRRPEGRPGAASKMPLNLLAGATDHITPPAQVFAAADVMSDAQARRDHAHHHRRPPRPVHGPRGAARPLAADPGRGARALASRRRRKKTRRAQRARQRTPAKRRTIPAP